MALGRAGPQPGVPTVGLQLIPRDAEQQAITRLLLSEGTPQVSLVGPPGAGKMRLALMAAAQVAPIFADGVVFVDLSMLQDPKRVGAAIGAALGMREIAPDNVLARLIAALRKKHVLLILDNFEHLLSAASIAADLVAACPMLRVVTTTREALRLKIEHRFTVNPLPLPAAEIEHDVEELRQVPSVALFCLRVAAVESTWTLDARNSHAVAELCRRLDGLPLAIELAAAWTGVLSPRAVLNRLERFLSTDTGLPRYADQPEGHRTLSAAIGWSYDLLDPGERAFFDTLAVFVDGWDEEAALLSVLSPLAPRYPSLRHSLTSTWSRVLSSRSMGNHVFDCWTL